MMGQRLAAEALCTFWLVFADCRSVLRYFISSPGTIIWLRVEREMNASA